MIETPATALVAGSSQSQDKNVLPAELLDRMAAELNKIDRLTAPVLLQCGDAFAVFIRDPHDARRGKRNRYAWTRHATEDQARFFFACAPGHVVPVDDIAAKNIYAAERSKTNG